MLANLAGLACMYHFRIHLNQLCPLDWLDSVLHMCGTLQLLHHALCLL